jgi:hypothetical protein
MLANKRLEMDQNKNRLTRCMSNLARKIVRRSSRTAIDSTYESRSIPVCWEAGLPVLGVLYNHWPGEWEHSGWRYR